jgi:hypothetical protein
MRRRCGGGAGRRTAPTPATPTRIPLVTHVAGPEVVVDLARDIQAVGGELHPRVMRRGVVDEVPEIRPHGRLPAADVDVEDLHPLELADQRLALGRRQFVRIAAPRRRQAVHAKLHTCVNSEVRRIGASRPNWNCSTSGSGAAIALPADGSSASRPRSSAPPRRAEVQPPAPLR